MSKQTVTVKLKAEIIADPKQPKAEKLAIRYQEGNSWRPFLQLSDLGDEVIDPDETSPLTLEIDDVTGYRVYGVTMGPAGNPVDSWSRSGKQSSYTFQNGYVDMTEIVLGAIPIDDRDQNALSFMSNRKGHGGGNTGRDQG